jgi:hypothetical protein
MRRNLLNLVTILLLLLAVAFGVHSALLPDTLADQYDIMKGCYVGNYLLAIGIYWAVLACYRSNAVLVGFVFMGGSFLKFGLFFLLVYPVFSVDGTASSGELTLFFIPYLISLLTLTISASRVLQRA